MTAEFYTVEEGADFARHELARWYRENKRVFPWRVERDPYKVLMAEMMLRRTRAAQVVAVYVSFVARFPHAAALDDAAAEEVADLLRPLGLYWRAANFKEIARELVSRHNGNVPSDRLELLALTGVGPYVADAVRCFAFGVPVALIDSNTVRVAARYYGFDYNQESRRRTDVIRMVGTLIDADTPESSNYALLDFAAQVCRALDPRHEECPLRTRCRYYIDKTHDTEGAPGHD